MTHQSAGTAGKSATAAVVCRDGSASGRSAGYLAEAGPLTDDPAVRQRDTAAGDVAAHHVTSVPTVDVTRTGATATDRAIVPACQCAARGVMTGEGAVIDALPAATRRTCAVDAAAGFWALKVARVEITTDARSVYAIVLPVIVASRQADKLCCRPNERNPAPHGSIP